MNAAIPSFPEPIYQTHDPLRKFRLLRQ